MRKIHFTEINPLTFGREVAYEIIDAAEGRKWSIDNYRIDFGPFWDRVWNDNRLQQLTDDDVESRAYMDWAEEAEISMFEVLNEQS